MQKSHSQPGWFFHGFETSSVAPLTEYKVGWHSVSIFLYGTTTTTKRWVVNGQRNSEEFLQTTRKERCSQFSAYFLQFTWKKKSGGEGGDGLCCVVCVFISSFICSALLLEKISQPVLPHQPLATHNKSSWCKTLNTPFCMPKKQPQSINNPVKLYRWMNIMNVCMLFSYLNGFTTKLHVIIGIILLPLFNITYQTITNNRR